MTAEQQAETINPRVEASLPFVEALARRVAATMPHSIDLGDLVQDGVLGLIDAARRFEESRGIKFETFAERRVRGAMIDALRKDAWPRGVRRVRRELEAARERLRVTLGHEPSLADLAAAVGSDEERLGKVIVRINDHRADLAAVVRRQRRRVAAAGRAGAGRGRAPRRRLRAPGSGRPRPRRHRHAAAARAPRHRALLLRRSHDEGNRRRARRERVARVAAACPRAAPPARGPRPRRAPDRVDRSAAQRRGGVRAPAAHGQGRPAVVRTRSSRRPPRPAPRGAASSSTTPAPRAPRAASRRAGTAWRATGIRSPRGSARRRCRPRRRSRR